MVDLGTAAAAAQIGGQLIQLINEFRKAVHNIRFARQQVKDVYDRTIIINSLVSMFSDAIKYVQLRERKSGKRKPESIETLKDAFQNQAYSIIQKLEKILHILAPLWKNRKSSNWSRVIAKVRWLRYKPQVGLLLTDMHLLESSMSLFATLSLFHKADSGIVKNALQELLETEYIKTDLVFSKALRQLSQTQLDHSISFQRGSIVTKVRKVVQVEFEDLGIDIQKYKKGQTISNNTPIDRPGSSRGSSESVLYSTRPPRPPTTPPPGLSSFPNPRSSVGEEQVEVRSSTGSSLPQSHEHFQISRDLSRSRSVVREDKVSQSSPRHIPQPPPLSPAPFPQDFLELLPRLPPATHDNPNPSTASTYIPTPLFGPPEMSQRPLPGRKPSPISQDNVIPGRKSPPPRSDEMKAQSRIPPKGGDEKEDKNMTSSSSQPGKTEKHIIVPHQPKGGSGQQQQLSQQKPAKTRTRIRRDSTGNISIYGIDGEVTPFTAVFPISRPGNNRGSWSKH
ncbi:hypothetical protein BGW36DRAFT_434445 [Talaromyces proteolyticus]|uniref:Uncharacterized protein n=1 Tax=Talaromyces proteolyticus TaxID=1131652 RepID=A0AAD4L2P6_9EURO|nr:uncharacterized protein BGW36DRAFT_434445 [Talaromyces proteolyticus]KAH8704827.1 hypothetical protein BGW36DRAFT_434445 [Talaromyces proteolyticus]